MQDDLGAKPTDARRCALAIDRDLRANGFAIVGIPQGMKWVLVPDDVTVERAVSRVRSAQAPSDA